ncbi:hypothetical protein HPB51_008057 [Rhipicephalus microplus]|uniref:Uncharacterized protein n=1 Tax=Rhipicephalus microplus TaxID=6941 RepID=A0A9J6EFV0_RHIMP|nr:hypothetical protein HPB51_008057 [Rhipicephalus microplus]
MTTEERNNALQGEHASSMSSIPYSIDLKSSINTSLQQRKTAVVPYIHSVAHNLKKIGNKFFATVTLLALVASAAFAEEDAKKVEKKEDKKDVEGRGGFLGGGPGFGVGVVPGVVGSPGVVGPGVVANPALVLVQALEHSRRASREALLDTSKDPEPSQGVQLTGLLTPSATTRATTTRPASQLPIARPLEQANSRDLRVSREVPLDIRLDSGSRLTAILPVSATRVSALSAESSGL